MKNLAFLFVLACVPIAQAQTFEHLVETSKIASAEGREAIKKAKKEMTTIRKEYQKMIAALNDEFKRNAGGVVSALSKDLVDAKKTASDADDLDEAVRLRDLSEKLEKLRVVPALDFSAFEGSWVWLSRPDNSKAAGIQLTIFKPGTVGYIVRDNYGRTKKYEGRLVRRGDSEILVMFPDSDQNFQIVLTGSDLTGLFGTYNNQKLTKILKKKW